MADRSRLRKDAFPGVEGLFDYPHRTKRDLTSDSSIRMRHWSHQLRAVGLLLSLPIALAHRFFLIWLILHPIVLLVLPCRGTSIFLFLAGGVDNTNLSRGHFFTIGMLSSGADVRLGQDFTRKRKMFRGWLRCVSWIRLGDLWEMDLWPP